MNTSDSLSVKTAKLSDDELKAQIIHLARICERVHQNNLPAAFNDKIFEPGISKLIMQPVSSAQRLKPPLGRLSTSG